MTLSGRRLGARTGKRPWSRQCRMPKPRRPSPLSWRTCPPRRNSRHALTTRWTEVHDSTTRMPKAFAWPCATNRRPWVPPCPRIIHWATRLVDPALFGSINRYPMPSPQRKKKNWKQQNSEKAALNRLTVSHLYYFIGARQWSWLLLSCTQNMFHLWKSGSYWLKLPYVLNLFISP